MSVPVIWDRQTRLRLPATTSHDIIIDLGTQFGCRAVSGVELYPVPLRAEIDALNERVYQTVNNGTYNVAGATTQGGLRAAAAAADRQLRVLLDARLAGSRYLFGDRITEADVRLWPTLARFDLSYNPLGKISERRLTSFPNLWGYARDLYQHPAFGETTDFAAFGGLLAGPAPSFVNDAPWRIDVEPAQADWDAPAPPRDPDSLASTARGSHDHVQNGTAFVLNCSRS